MSDPTPHLVFLSHKAYGDTEPEAAVQSIRDLVNLHLTGRVEIAPNILPELLPDVPDELENKCHGLICRPTWGGKVSQELVDRLRIPGERFFVASLSSGASHIKVVEKDGVKILCAEKGNAEQTAELTLFLAVCLLRRALSSMVNMGFGVYMRPDFNCTRSLSGAKWVVAGAGPVGEAVLRKAAALGAGKLCAYYHKFDEMAETEIAEKHKGLSGLEVDFTGDLKTALSDADVLSLHMPARDDNVGVVDETWFDLLPDEAVVVNCARHEVVNDAALLASLEAGRIAGYASDVLPPDSERRSANPHSPNVELWRRACWSMINSIERCTYELCAFQEDGLAGRFLSVDRLAESNLVYTPHIGGSTLDAEEDVAKEVITDLRRELGVTRWP